MLDAASLFDKTDLPVSGVRDHALALACRRRGLPAAHGRGFDDLPAEVLAPFDDALVRSLEPEELRRALAGAVAGLLRESVEVADLAARLEASLRELVSPAMSSDLPRGPTHQTDTREAPWQS